MEQMGAEDDYNEYFGLAQHKLEKLTNWDYTGLFCDLSTPGGSRTHNRLIRSQVLCPLSYGRASVISNQ